jgi:hypothetical protein
LSISERLQQEESKEAVARRMMAQLRRRLYLKPGEYREVIIDWTRLGRDQVLTAFIRLAGRAVPVWPWAVAKWPFKVSQNATEEQFVQSLRRWIRKAWEVVLVADRGFRRTAFLGFRQGLGFCDVIRLKAEVWIESREYGGKRARLSPRGGAELQADWGAAPQAATLPQQTGLPLCPD